MSTERVPVTTLWVRGQLEDNSRRCWGCGDHVFPSQRNWTCGEIMLCGDCFEHLQAQSERAMPGIVR